MLHMRKTVSVSLEPIQSRILILRGVRVILDADLARIYGVSTKRLNEQVKRNSRKFPEDFMFRLTAREKAEVVANCDHLRKLRFAKSAPCAFTEHGAIQAANILNSPAATEMSVHVVRAFVQIRQLVVNHKAIAVKLSELETKLGIHDQQLSAIIAAIRHLTSPDGPRHRRKIGFHQGNR